MVYKVPRPPILRGLSDARVALPNVMLKVGSKPGVELLGFLRLKRVDVKHRQEMVRPERFELPTFWFVARRSIQLS